VCQLRDLHLGWNLEEDMASVLFIIQEAIVVAEPFDQ
jgi:hypothetical protein